MRRSFKISCLSVFLFLGMFFISSCDNSYYPKPRGYFRIDLPEKSYSELNLDLPYNFEYPNHAILSQLPNTEENYGWINIIFPQFKGTLYLSYKRVNNNLEAYFEDTHTMVMKHISKSTGIENQIYENQEKNIYGMTFTIEGMDVASPYQFYLTDSTQNFLRGALYFDAVPNNDSLKPVIEFLKEEIHHMIETLEWKETNKGY